MLRFNDGVEIDTSGELRVMRLKDGYYVIGQGWCIPVDSMEEANKEIERMKGCVEEKQILEKHY